MTCLSGLLVPRHGTRAGSPYVRIIPSAAWTARAPAAGPKSLTQGGGRFVLIWLRHIWNDDQWTRCCPADCAGSRRGACHMRTRAARAAAQGGRNAAFARHKQSELCTVVIRIGRRVLLSRSDSPRVGALHSSAWPPRYGFGAGQCTAICTSCNAQRSSRCTTRERRSSKTRCDTAHCDSATSAAAQRHAAARWRRAGNRRVLVAHHHGLNPLNLWCRHGNEA